MVSGALLRSSRIGGWIMRFRASRAARFHVFGVFAALLALSTSLVVSAASVTYTYDEAGRLKLTTFDNTNSTSYALDAAGNRNSVVASVDTTAPSVPTLTATSTSSNLVSLSWTASTDTGGSGLKGYNLYRGGVLQNTSGYLTITSYSDTTVSAGISYSYTVKAYDNALNASAASTPAVVTPPDTTAPSAPGTPTFSNIIGTTAQASWTAATDNVGVTSYQYSLNGGGWIGVGNVLTVSLTGLTYSANYTFAVRALDAAGNPGPASSGSFTAAADTTPPSAPGTPTFSNIIGTTAQASWTAATDNVGVTSYQYSLNGGGWISVGNVLTVSLTGLTYSANYTFAVRALDAAGNPGPASSGSFTAAADTTPPSAPGTPTFSNITGTTAQASWTAATDNVGVTSYQYSLNGGGWIGVGNVLTVSLTGLTFGANYTFAVRALDAAGNPGPASSGSFTAAADTTPPSAPGVPSFSAITSTTATASWTAATDNVGVTGYEYQRNGGSWTAIGNVLTVNLTGLTGGTLYTIGVRAKDAAGNPGAVSSNSFRTPEMPTMTEGAVTLGVTSLGFNFSIGMGSMSPATTADGKTYRMLDDISHSTVSGFALMNITVDPGQAWLVSVTAHGVTKTGSSANYTYDATNHTATWAWTVAPLFGFTGTGTTVCTIFHN